MEQFIQFASENIQSAPWIFFVLILLAGLNVPVSIDIIMISAGVLAESYFSLGSAIRIYLLLSLACWLAAWEAYAMGRFLGPKLYHIKWFKHILSLKRIEKLHLYYEKYGILVFLIGRFIPGGVRNALFMTSGLGKMPFHKFILRDLIPCFLSSALTFSLGILFSTHYDRIIEIIKTYNIAVLGILAALAIFFIFNKTCLTFRKP